MRKTGKVLISVLQPGTIHNNRIICIKFLRQELILYGNKAVRLFEK